MTDAERSSPAVSHGNRWPAALASLAVGAAFFALWFRLLPRWLGFSVEMAGAARWRWLAVIPSALGFAWDFGWTGRGTPAPVAPPKRLVVVGFYRYVRNPMYVGFAAGWIALWVMFGLSCGRSHCARRSPVRGVLRGANSAQEVRGRLRRVLSERESLVAACAGLG
jgi:protein-S-isoprenylcysteine O-methyltransferase Ste14